MTDFIRCVSKQVIEGLWDDLGDAAFAHRLTPDQTRSVAREIASPSRPGDGSDQPSIPVDADGWGFPLAVGAAQPTLF